MGTARNTMNMVLIGPDGSLLPQMVFADPHRKVQDTDGLLYGLEVTGIGGHWSEFSRLIAPGGISKETQRLMDAYAEFHEFHLFQPMLKFSCFLETGLYFIFYYYFNIC